MIPLESLTSCFQGLIPAWLCTCSRDGVPNVAILSHVDYVDPRHVALSFQFFNKSKRNIAENPKAMVRFYDPDTMQAYALRLRFVRTETEGPTFESMRLRIEAIASYSGLKGIFKLLGADIYEVLSVQAIEYEVGAARRGGQTSDVAGRPAAVHDESAAGDFRPDSSGANARLSSGRDPRNVGEELRFPPFHAPARVGAARSAGDDRQPRLSRGRRRLGGWVR